MEWTTSDLLDQYRRADFTKRLHLYLQYPELRADFTEIDRKDLHDEKQGCIIGSEGASEVPVRSLFGLKSGYARRILGRRRVMSISQGESKNFGNLCCRSWTHQRNPARKKKIGILLVTIGLIWLGASVGMLDFSWLQAIHFWPVVLILLGVWMVYKGFMRGIQEQVTTKQRRYEMETMFSKMMEGCMEGMSEEDKKKMMACGEKMAALFSLEGKKAIREKMMAYCGSKMELMSAYFKKTGSTSDQTCCSEKS